MQELYQVSLRNRRQEKEIGTQLCECCTINSGDHWGNNLNDHCVYLGFFLFFLGASFVFCYFKVAGFLKVVFSSTTELIKQACIPSEEVLEATVAKFS